MMMTAYTHAYTHTVVYLPCCTCKMTRMNERTLTRKRGGKAALGTGRSATRLREEGGLPFLT